MGADFFRENKGHFWSMLETRPYMRARYELADLLQATGRTSEAIRHFEAMLELNPNDNQGVCDDLLGLYLATDNLEGARRLLREYEEDDSAVFTWGRALERYLSGDQEGAMRALKQARKSNPYVNGYLSGKKRLPPDVPATYSYGSEDEAVLCADTLRGAWWRHPQAVQWLKSRF
jgi:tetratricopeptide (TPR) repeat protein